MRRITSAALFAATALLTGIAESASAADMGAPPVYRPVAPLVVPYSWTGIYWGANIGYSWGRVTNDWGLFGFPFANETQKMNGVIGGGQSGFNWQVGSWVFGVESDFQGSGQKGTTIYCLFACALPPSLINVSAEHKLPWFGTARSRIGFLATDNVLLYGTAGVAYGQVQSNYSLNVLGNASVASLNFKDTRAGWTAGAGVEVAFGAGWSAKLEYLCIDLGRNTETINITTLGTVASWNNRVTDNIVHVGLNYRVASR
jgi:outer membrane immunogenic protein